MKTDILNRNDIEQLVNVFYEKVKIDESIGYFFTEVRKVNWEKHLPIMYDFWENVIFFTGNYEGNPMIQHKRLHEKSEMTLAHFEQWILLFNETVDELFEGENARTIKQKADNIARIMHIKISQ